MKKTVLSLALVTLVVDAFANTSLYSTNTTNLYISGSAYINALAYGKNNVITAINPQEQDFGKANFISSINSKLGLGFNINFPNNLTSAGIKIKIDSLLKNNSFNNLKRNKHLEIGIFPINLSTYFTTPDYGTLTIGKNTTTIFGDEVVDSGLYTDGMSAIFFTANDLLGNQTKLDNVIKYTSFVKGNFQFRYSFGISGSEPTIPLYNSSNVYYTVLPLELTQASKSSSSSSTPTVKTVNSPATSILSSNDFYSYHQNSASLSYNFDWNGQNTITGMMTFDKEYAKAINALNVQKVAYKANNYQISFTNNGYIKNLILTASYNFGSQDIKKEWGSSVNARSLLIKGTYFYSPLIQPYFGLGYVRKTVTSYNLVPATQATTMAASSKPEAEAKSILPKTKTFTYEGYIGINSQVYTYKTLNVNAYVETALSVSNSRYYMKDTSQNIYKRLGLSKNTALFGIAAGIQINF